MFSGFLWLFFFFTCPPFDPQEWLLGGWYVPGRPSPAMSGKSLVGKSAPAAAQCLVGLKDVPIFGIFWDDDPQWAYVAIIFYIYIYDFIYVSYLFRWVEKWFRTTNNAVLPCTSLISKGSNSNSAQNPAFLKSWDRTGPLQAILDDITWFKDYIYIYMWLCMYADDRYST